MSIKITIGFSTSFLFLVAFALSSCSADKQPETQAAAGSSEAIAAAISQPGTSYVCSESKTNSDVTSCACKVKGNSTYTCKGMAKLCKKMGGGEPECSTDPRSGDWCSCAFVL